MSKNWKSKAESVVEAELNRIDVPLIVNLVAGYVRDDEFNGVRDYVLKRMGHCDDCAWVDAWETDGADPNTVECDCAYHTVEGLFTEYEKEA